MASLLLPHLQTLTVDVARPDTSSSLLSSISKPIMCGHTPCSSKRTSGGGQREAAEILLAAILGMHRLEQRPECRAALLAHVIARARWTG